MPATKEDVQFLVESIREDIKQLNHSRSRLLELSHSWWLRKSHNDLLHGASALGVRIAEKWRALNDATFQLEVMTKGKLEASVNRAMRVLVEKAEEHAYALCGCCGGSQVVRAMGHDGRVRSWPCDECKPNIIGFAKALENAEKQKYEQQKAIVYPINPNTDTQPY
jgi:hypothetical protein